MLTLGLDPGLNNVGYCFLGSGQTESATTIKAPKEISQFEKIVAQKEFLAKALEHNKSKIEYVGIEQPYVQGSGFRGGGGEQSANMWAVYTMMLDEIRKARLPVVMFNITQFHSLIIRRRGITKKDIIAKASEEYPSLGKLDEHSADAYHVAKNARAFWLWMDGHILSPTLSEDQRDIFLGRRVGSKGDLSGIIWRSSDFWYDFRYSDPLTIPIGLKTYVAEGSSGIST